MFNKSKCEMQLKNYTTFTNVEYCTCLVEWKCDMAVVWQSHSNSINGFNAQLQLYQNHTTIIS